MSTSGIRIGPILLASTTARAIKSSNQAPCRNFGPKGGLTGAGLQFQPNDQASALCFGSACSASDGDRAEALASLREYAIQARGYHNPPRHRHPYFGEN
jgi:hypothetical protein